MLGTARYDDQTAQPWAFVAEAVIACGMMLMGLEATNTPKLTRYIGIFAGSLDLSLRRRSLEASTFVRIHRSDANH